MTEPTILRRLVAISDGLTAAGLSHAFGGAIALAFHVQEPRATSDIDVNISTDDPETAFRAMPSAVGWDLGDLERCRRDGQVRLFWVEEPFRTPVDVFLPQSDLHVELDRQAQLVDVLGRQVRILTATHLTVFKALFDRTKDWADIEAMLANGQVDVRRVREWLGRLVGEDDDRLARLTTAEHTAAAAGSAPVFRDLLRRTDPPS